MPAADTGNGQASAAAEIMSRADQGGAEMIAAFRAMFLSPATGPPEDGCWGSQVLRGLGLLQVPRTLVTRQDHQMLFEFARSERFLHAQAEEFPRSRPGRPCADPLWTIDQALMSARELDRVPEMAAFTLSRARWGTTMAAWTPLTALRAGHQDLACQLADSQPVGQQAFWYLLMAWERYDAGSGDDARRLLGRLLPKHLPRLGVQASRHIRPLLRHAAEISREAFEDLQQRLLDDNDRTDLCRELTAAGQIAVVPAVAATITLFISNQIPVLAQVAKAAMAVGQPELAATAIAQAIDTFRLVEAGDHNDVGTNLAENLAQVAGAQAAAGELGTAARTFARALESCGGEGFSYSVAPTLRTIAAEQAMAGLFTDAGQTITRIADSHYQGEALEALAVAQVRAGQAATAVRTLDAIDPDLYLDYPRAARDVARALADTGQAELAVDVTRRWLRPEQHAGSIAAVATAAAAAGAVAQAMTLADSITEPGAHARALTGICRAPGGHQAAATARRAVADLPDPSLRAELLAELATTEAEQDRGPLLGEALHLAGTLSGEERWNTLLAIGVVQLTADRAGAPATFAAIRQTIRETEPDSDFWTDELCQVAIAQASVGDAAGARQTFAEIMGDPVPDLGTWLKPLTLAGIAISQADTGETKPALRTCGLALQQTAPLRGHWQPVVYRAIATAQAAAGDLHAAAETAGTMLDIAETAAEDDDEDTVTAAVEQGIHAAVQVARELSRIGRRKQARRLLSDVAARAREWLESSMFIYAEAMGELACAPAELGKVGKAAKVAGWDMTGSAADRMHAVAAGHQAGDGNLDDALATSAAIRDPRVMAQAFGAVSRALTRRDERAAARTVLADAARRLRVAEPAILAVPALTAIAAAQADTGCQEDIAATLALARLAASDLDRADDKDYALCQIAQSWALHGDPARALELAAGIANDDHAGQALVTAALAMASRDRDDWPAATAVIDGVRSPGWQAVGLAAAGAAKTKGQITDTRQYFAQVGQLVSQVPEGQPRARAQRGIIDVALASGDYKLAVDVARAVTVDRSQVLSELAGELASRGAADAVKSMLADCALQRDSAYAACLALARAAPRLAEAIIKEVRAA